MKKLLETAQLGFKPIIDEILSILNSMPHHSKSQIYDMDRFNSVSLMSQNLHRTSLKSTNIDFHIFDFSNDLALTNLKPTPNCIDLKSMNISVENTNIGLCMIVKSLKIIKSEENKKTIYSFGDYEDKIEVFHYVNDKENFLSSGYISFTNGGYSYTRIPEIKIEKYINGFEQISTLLKLNFEKILKEMLFLGKDINKQELDLLSITHDLNIDLEFMNDISINLNNLSNAKNLKHSNLKN